MKATSSLRHLVISNTRHKLIGIFFCSPQEIFYVRQLVRLTKEEINSVRRELQNLQNADIISSETRGNRLYYWANKKSSLFTDLLVLANKISGLGFSILEKRDLVGNIRILLCSYRLISGDPNPKGDIDIIIVGAVSPHEIDTLIKQEEIRRGREINYMIMDRNELHLRKSKRDPFLVDFFLNCPLVIIGSPSDIFP